MRILLLHNYYRQPGGEDVVFAAERDLLRRFGHQVWTWTESNARAATMPPWAVAARALWSRAAQRQLAEFLQSLQPDLVHIHNPFVMFSPSVFYAARRAGVPVVFSLHNQRLFCPKATMYRPEKPVCTECVGRWFPWPAVKHRCYHHSRTQTLAVAAMVALHQWLGTWQRQVDAYIVFTEFFRRQFAAWGLPPERLFVKPHFVYPDPGRRPETFGDYALFVGRLDPEKGVRTLLQAWERLPSVPLRIRGTGPLLAEVQAAAAVHPHIRWVPRLERPALMRLFQGARFLVWPSEGWYENFGLVAIEAFACGVPVLAARTGVLPELVDDGRTGLLFEPGNPEDLVAKVAWAWAHPAKMAALGREARREYEAKYTAERNYEMLMAIYQRVLA